MKESCPKIVILMKTKNNTFLTFLDKMLFSAILCLATYMTGFVQMGDKYRFDVLLFICTNPKSEHLVLLFANGGP